MTQMNFPPASILCRVKKIKIRVDTDGTPALMDEVCQQLIAGVLHNAGGDFEIVSSHDPSADTVLRYAIDATVISADGRNRPLAYAYLARIDLFAAVPGHEFKELFIIYTSQAYGYVQASDFYDTVTASVRLHTAKLAEAIMEL